MSDSKVDGCVRKVATDILQPYPADEGLFVPSNQKTHRPSSCTSSYVGAYERHLDAIVLCC